MIANESGRGQARSLWLIEERRSLSRATPPRLMPNKRARMIGVRLRVNTNESETLLQTRFCGIPVASRRVVLCHEWFVPRWFTHQLCIVAHAHGLTQSGSLCHACGRLSACSCSSLVSHLSLLLEGPLAADVPPGFSASCTPMPAPTTRFATPPVIERRSIDRLSVPRRARTRAQNPTIKMQLKTIVPGQQHSREEESVGVVGSSGEI
ncbi:uncharacterized protein LOC143211366 isoform X2 [Lasioglossum baleicum]|uniref:uncharacterized protein LOC143211366 isoform X2 n=1 Tax=Lasioglossum baleicum TaxID=434251 RepID=UPI003FCCA970